MRNFKRNTRESGVNAAIATNFESEEIENLKIKLIIKEKIK